MRKLFIVSVLLLMGAVILLWVNRSALAERGLEKWIAHTQSELFEGPVEIEGLKISSDLFVTIKSIRGVWKTQEDGFAFELRDIQTEARISNFLRRKPVNIVFGQLRPMDSHYQGVSGRLTLHNNKDESFEIQAKIKGLYLEELKSFNPEILSKTSGKLIGNIFIKADKTKTDEIRMTLDVAAPGGHLPAYFFDSLLPYLPEAEKKALSQIQERQSVDYQSSHVALELAEKDAMKILFQIKVPDYNLNLNLNLTLRVEDNASFLELAQLMGMTKVGVS